MAGAITFSVVYLFIYKPHFQLSFLPYLETAKEVYENKQKPAITKCRQKQLSNFSLALIFYVLDKSCGNTTLQCNDHFAGQLSTLYGVDSGSLKKSLAIIIGGKQNFSQRKATELRQQFEEAYSFFASITYRSQVELLQKIECKLLC